MKDYTIYNRLIILVLFVLAAMGCGPSHFTTFEKASEYWRGLKGVEYIDPSAVAKVTGPMISQTGIQYLIDKMERGTGEKSEIAVLCLSTIYEILLDDPSDESRRLRGPIEKSKLIEQSAFYADKGSNEAIRYLLAAFVKRPKMEAVTPRQIAVSGPEQWVISGRSITIHDTCIYMRDPKGPLFSVVVDKSRNPIAEMIDPVPELFDLKAIARHAFEKGYFHKAQEIQFAGQKLKLQDRIDLWIGQNSRDGYGAVRSFEGGYSLQDLGISSKEGAANQQVDGTRP